MFRVLNHITSSAVVEYVEQDHVVHHSACQIETNATWGIDRIDSHALALDTLYHWNDATAGEGVTAYVIDT